MSNKIYCKQIDEHQLQVCINHSRWGYANRKPKWKKNDVIIFFVEGKLAAKAIVMNSETIEEESLWSDEKYKSQIHIEFNLYIDESNRESKAKEILTTSSSKNFGFLFISDNVIKDEDILNKLQKELLKANNMNSLNDLKNHYSERLIVSYKERLDKKIQNVISTIKKSSSSMDDEFLTKISTMWFFNLILNKEKAYVPNDLNDFNINDIDSIANALKDQNPLVTYFIEELNRINLSDKELKNLNNNFEDILKEVKYGDKRYKLNNQNYMSYCLNIIFNNEKINSGKIFYLSTDFLEEFKKMIELLQGDAAIEIIDHMKDYGNLSSGLSNQLVKKVYIKNKPIAQYRVSVLRNLVNLRSLDHLSLIDISEDRETEIFIEDGDIRFELVNSSLSSPRNFFDDWSINNYRHKDVLIGIFQIKFKDEEWAEVRKKLAGTFKNIVISMINVNDWKEDRYILFVGTNMSHGKDHLINIIGENEMNNRYIQTENILNLIKGSKISSGNSLKITVKQFISEEFNDLLGIKKNKIDTQDSKIESGTETKDNYFESNNDLGNHSILNILNHKQIDVLNFLLKLDDRSYPIDFLYTEYKKSNKLLAMDFYKFKSTLQILKSVGILVKQNNDSLINSDNILRNYYVSNLEMWSLNDEVNKSENS